MNIQPYLYFNGRCEEAFEFYREALGAESLMMMRFNESPIPHQPGMLPPGNEAKIMHMSFRVGETTVLASDGRCAGEKAFQNFGLALQVKDAAEAERCFKALEAGGSVVMPLGATFFSPMFGMVSDKFGVVWLVIAQGAPA
jgi:PhnB protein